MKLGHIFGTKRGRKLAAFIFLLSLLGFAPRASASASLLLEEPYGRLGAFSATGHAAVYLNRVCAETPVVLRRCRPGESGVVISRYDHISGYDWIAIPIVPYLYAVEQPQNVPLYADPKLVAFLRNQYRKKYLREVAPDAPDGEVPGGNWTQLVGSAYDRTLYSYEVKTTAEQDDAFIRAFNSSPNRESFRTLSSNCADFAKDVINFYYPHAVHRSVIADVGIMTPKQAAKSLAKFGKRHPELEYSITVIPQVPGSLPRSTRVHGVMESFLKSKKYVVPATAWHPAVMACVAVVYLGSGHFNPSRDALVLNSQREAELPLAPAQRRAYQSELKQLLAENNRSSTRQDERTWKQVQAEAKPGFDDSGRPILEVRDGEKLVDVGISRENILTSSDSAVLEQELLAARLREELRRGPDKISESDVVSDWKLLQRTLPTVADSN